MAATDINTLSHADTERRGIFGRALDFLVRIAECNHRVRRVQALSAMSDAQLAARGLKREDITRHVFQDMLYV